MNKHTQKYYIIVIIRTNIGVLHDCFKHGWPMQSTIIIILAHKVILLVVTQKG